MLKHIALACEGHSKEALLWNGGLAALREWKFGDMSRLHLRYKVACWLRGLMSHPTMRRPMPAPRWEEIGTTVRFMRDALAK